MRVLHMMSFLSLSVQFFKTGSATTRILSELELEFHSTDTMRVAVLCNFDMCEERTAGVQGDHVSKKAGS